MSFSYLPWQLYVVLSIGVAILVIMYTIKIKDNFPKIFSMGLILASCGAIAAGIIKLLVSIHVFYEYIFIVKIFGIALTALGIISILIGSFIKVKNDPYKKKMMLIMFFIFGVTILFCLIIVLTSI